LIKTIFSAGILSGLNSLFGFLFTLVIIQKIGLAPLGSVTIYLSVISIGTLPLFLLPNSYAVVKIQDSKEFGYYFKCILLILSLFSGVVSSFSSFLFVKDTYVSMLIPVYAMLQVLQVFYDVTYQSNGFQIRYFLAVSCASAIKLVILVIWVLFSENHNNVERILFFIIFTGQVILVAALAKGNPSKSGAGFLTSGVFGYYLSIYHEVKGFFLVAIFKRGYDSLPPIIAARFYSLELVGLLSLMLKILNVSTTFAKILEVYLLKRENRQSANIYFNYIVIMAGLIMTIIISMLYSNIVVEIDLVVVFVLSIISIIMAFSMFLRSTLTVSYNTKALASSYFIALSVQSFGIIFLSVFDKYGILISYMLGVFSMFLVMSFKSNQ
jgi:hypothetical protein